MVRVSRDRSRCTIAIEPQIADLSSAAFVEPSALPPPDPLDAFDVHHPAGVPQHGRDRSIAITAVLGGERDWMSAVRTASDHPPIIRNLRCVDRSAGQETDTQRRSEEHHAWQRQ